MATNRRRDARRIASVKLYSKGRAWRRRNKRRKSYLDGQEDVNISCAKSSGGPRKCASVSLSTGRAFHRREGNAQAGGSAGRRRCAIVALDNVNIGRSEIFLKEEKGIRREKEVSLGAINRRMGKVMWQKSRRLLVSIAAAQMAQSDRGAICTAFATRRNACHAAP